jgi:hypothetical protein
MSIVLVGSTSGSITLQEPAVAGTTTISLPATTGTVVLQNGSNNLLMNSGYGSDAVAYGCRAWVNFNGQGTVAIRASGNVSSITDGGAGIFSVNFTTAMPDINYSISVNASLSFASFNLYSPSLNAGSGGNEVAPTTSSCSMYIAQSDNVAFDPKYVNVAIFR